MAVYIGYLNEKERHNKIPLTSTDGKNQKIWVSAHDWASPYEIISDGSDVPEEIGSLMKKWSRHIDELKEGFDYKWYIKHAAVEFIFGEKYYRLCPGSITASHELFDHVVEGIKSDLNKIGCPYVKYIGDMD